MLPGATEIESREICAPGSSFSAFGFLSFLMITFNLGQMRIMRSEKTFFDLFLFSAVNIVANVNSNSNSNSQGRFTRYLTNKYLN